MKLCVLSDIHGNIHYLNAVLEACAVLPIDHYFFLGDAVGYFPDGAAVLQRLREINAYCVKGNHEARMLGMIPFDEEKDKVYRLTDQLRQLDESDLQYIKSWPVTRQHEYDGTQIHFLHGTISDPLNGYGYENGEFSEFNQPNLDVMFVGQTHRPWKQKNTHTLIVNVGSVGLPRDYGNSPSFAILDTVTKVAEIQRIKVDSAPLIAAAADLHPAVIECLNRR